MLDLSQIYAGFKSTKISDKSSIKGLRSIFGDRIKDARIYDKSLRKSVIKRNAEGPISPQGQYRRKANIAEGPISPKAQYRERSEPIS